MPFCGVNGCAEGVGGVALEGSSVLPVSMMQRITELPIGLSGGRVLAPSRKKFRRQSSSLSSPPKPQNRAPQPPKCLFQVQTSCLSER